jgi:hypothetical protein
MVKSAGAGLPRLWLIPLLPALSGLLGVSCLSSPEPLPRAYDPCPHELTCPNSTCCPLGFPFQCGGGCYQAATSCGASYVTCSGSSDSVPGGGSGSATGASRTCGQACQDQLSGFALDDTMWLAYNENVAGKTSGSVDETGACPLGGNVHITGTIDVVADGTVTLHLAFDFMNCSNSGSTYSIGFTGSVSVNGTYNGRAGSKFTSITLMSSSLVMSGDLKYLDDPSIAETCAMTVTQQDQSGGSSSLDGSVCGREFSSASSMSGGGGTGSGGSSGAGGSTGEDCTCYCGWPADTKCRASSDCPNDTSEPGTSVPGVCGKPVTCSACAP